MKNLVKKDWLIWLILLIPFIVIIYYWNQFPDKIPTHWNINGKVDRYGGKFDGLVLMPLVNIGLYFLLLALPKIDPKKANYALFKEPYHIMRFIIHIFLFLLFIVTVFIALGHTLPIERIVPLGVFTMFLLMGNYMGTIRPNYFLGIKTPWTLANEDVWVKTHRLAGRIWVFASLIMLIVALIRPVNMPLMIAYIVILTVPAIVYSYLEFKKTEKKEA